MLGDNALQVTLAGQLKEALALSFDVIHIQERIAVCGNEPSQDLLPFNEWLLAEFLTIEPQQGRKTEACRVGTATH